jgi:NAD(P)-dependent dehydrogenase (short-subunit alcohol dehydrogenase family)
MNPLDAFRLDDRVVVLTGASSELGAGFARALAAVGADLVLAARRPEPLEALAAELRTCGTRIATQVADVSSPEACQAVADRAVAEFGRIDVLVNNAGVGHSVPSSRETPEAFSQVLNINLAGCFWMAQACAPAMPPGSAVVNVGSVLGTIAPRFPQAAYTASKAGVLGLTRSLAQEWTTRKGIRVNALSPGFLATEMTESGLDQIGEMIEAHSIMPRLGRQCELDSALLFLASPASSYVTGIQLLVDGGLSAV